MIKNLWLIILLFFAVCYKSQTIQLKGNIADTASKQSLPNVVLMAIKFTDSTLVNFTRTNINGIFKPITLPVDTYIVIISHPNFNDKTYLLVPTKNDTVFNFKNIVLPPKSVELSEVEIIAFKDKMYYKGDTLQFTADSFKVRPNATVEDLLKKLPGVKVDAAGKITIQGKTVDQVLVDGDEFFGSDPTIATKNLNANTIETVQVFEKKNENTESGDEMVKVVNLKLKEDSKKGYFGKVNAASDFTKFYEGELLANKFKKQQKISLFGLAANTPKNAFAWGDANKFGLNNESGMNYNEETNSWQGNQNNGTGIPQTLKSGFYFNDKFRKNIKLNTDYTFNNNQLTAGSETNNQFFLNDTSYSNKQQLTSTSLNQSHNFNFKLSTKIDSLTTLIIKPFLNYSTNSIKNLQVDEFYSSEDDLTRSTSIFNASTSFNTSANLNLTVERKFFKKDRQLNIYYKPDYYNSQTNTQLITDFVYQNNQLPNKTLLQSRKQLNNKIVQDAIIQFTEPLSKKFKLDNIYEIMYTKNTNNRGTLDKDTLGNDILNTTQSNNFDNTRILNRFLTKLIYDVKKYRFSVAAAYRNLQQQNINITTGQKLNQTFQFIVPSASAMFRINQGSNLSINYQASATPPDIMKLQPIVDNTDPNRINIGNPNLKPSFNNNVNINYYFYKGISDVNFYGGLNLNSTNNQISTITSFDSQGKATSQPINVDGNYYSNLYLGGGFPVFKRLFKINYNLSGSHSNNVSFINAQINNQQNSSINPSLSFEKDADKFDVSIGGDYTYNLPVSQINKETNQPYYTYGLQGRFNIKLTKKFNIETDANYTNNGNRAVGYNLNFIIWNAAIRETFLKTENLIVGFEANDILNQNISNTRNVFGNQITDTKTQIIKRFFLARIVYKFTSQKTKENSNELEMD